MGKTTTLNFMINAINSTRRAKIITIEDPVEFAHENNMSVVIQQEILSDVRSYQAALRHVLRQDPDVIVIGEMRDLETIETALIAAETGHLVIATLHPGRRANHPAHFLASFRLSNRIRSPSNWP